MNTTKISCYCDNEIEVEVPDAIDLAKHPEKEREILDGSFLSFRCSHCGKILKPEFPMHIVHKEKHLELFFLPELDRGAFSRGKAHYTLNDSTRGRVVIGYPELVEKLKILRDNLDDRIIEIIKFYLLERADTPDTVRAYYFAKTADAIELHVYGIREEEVGISKVPLHVYEQIAGELDQKATEDPFNSILEPPYVSTQKTYREAAE